jgi:hypothetical protein
LPIPVLWGENKSKLKKPLKNPQRNDNFRERICQDLMIFGWFFDFFERNLRTPIIFQNHFFGGKWIYILGMITGVHD